jgi:hypothetical protein
VAGVPARFIGTFDRFEQRGLAEFPSDADLKGESWRQRVNSIAENAKAPEMHVPSSAKADDGGDA